MKQQFYDELTKVELIGRKKSMFFLLEVIYPVGYINLRRLGRMLRNVGYSAHSSSYSVRYPIVILGVWL